MFRTPEPANASGPGLLQRLLNALEWAGIGIPSPWNLLLIGYGALGPPLGLQAPYVYP
jgi:hypothetical protein